MSRMSEHALIHDDYTHNELWMPTVQHAIERLEMLALQSTGNDLTEIATLLKLLVSTPTCRNCGAPVTVAAVYGGRAVFCSSACRAECLSI